MKNLQLFHRWVTSCVIIIMVFFAACDSEKVLTNEEILNSNLETITHSIISANVLKSGTSDIVKIYAYIDKEGNSSILNSRIIQSSGNEETDEDVLRYLEHANFLNTVKSTTNGKEVIFNISVKYYEPHPDIKFVQYDTPPAPIGGFKAIQEKIKYPEVALQAGIEGSVVIQSFIDDKGNMSKFNIIKGIPDSGLNDAALEALKQTKFTPAKKDGQDVGVWISIPIIFKLS